MNYLRWGADTMTETRTIILASCGGYVSMGRATKPTAEEIERAETALRQQGKTAWLCTMTGSPYSRAKKNRPKFSDAKLLCGEGDFDAAVAAFFDQEYWRGYAGA